MTALLWGTRLCPSSGTQAGPSTGSVGPPVHSDPSKHQDLAAICLAALSRNRTVSFLSHPRKIQPLSLPKPVSYASVIRNVLLDFLHQKISPRALEEIPGASLNPPQTQHRHPGSSAFSLWDSGSLHCSCSFSSPLSRTLGMAELLGFGSS